MVKELLCKTGIAGALNFHVNEIFVEAGLDAGDVSAAYTIMTAAGIATSLFVGGCVVDRIQRKSLVVTVACIAMSASCTVLVLAIDGRLRLSRWAAAIGFGGMLGIMSGAWEICYSILLADVFGLQILGTINGTLSTFGLMGATMCTGILRQKNISAIFSLMSRMHNRHQY